VCDGEEEEEDEKRLEMKSHVVVRCGGRAWWGDAAGGNGVLRKSHVKME
jgi:hypothetical protein